jgi:hypothetical protein
MHSEMGNIHSMLKYLHSLIMHTIHSLPPHPDYAEIRSNNAPISLEIPSNIPSHRKQQKTREEEDLQLPYLTVPGLNEPSSTSGPRASANGASPEGPDMY